MDKKAVDFMLYWPIWKHIEDAIQRGPPIDQNKKERGCLSW